MAHTGSAGGPTKLVPQKGTPKAEEEKIPAAPERAPEPAPQNTVVVQSGGQKPSGQPRVAVLLIVLFALEMVIHPGINTWLRGLMNGFNSALNAGGKQ
jgi:hypothetical protein